MGGAQRRPAQGWFGSRRSTRPAVADVGGTAPGLSRRAISPTMSRSKRDKAVRISAARRGSSVSA
jgi:hypothetical protein